MKERIQLITKKSKMMISSCIAIFAIIVLAIITTFTVSPKEAKGFSKTKETNAMKEEVNPALHNDSSNNSNSDSNTDLSKLLDGESQTKGFDTGYYFNGDQYITPNGPIEDLSGFTNDIVANKYFGKTVWSETDEVLDNGYSKSFSKMEGVSYWLTIDATEDASISLDYTTTASNDTLKTLVIFPDKTTKELIKGKANKIDLPQGKTEIAIVAFDAQGKVTVQFSNLTDKVSISQTE
ncbi:hypothetical protein bsdtb5_22130 [Anaeromicropila herbilytica]|uniref:Uncharacterized protein n=2 Tax=Anaeromicropila herbilytica TaxID=2785025 RepID=A0A7R7ICM9_9FIRM|nr:hypothetical protein bsdtb5_22130 [Anaeromicropila herbilytica]